MRSTGMGTGGQEGTEQTVDGRIRLAGGLCAYRVDAGAVAEAMLRHPGVRRLLGAPPLSPGGARTRAGRPPARRRA